MSKLLKNTKEDIQVFKNNLRTEEQKDPKSKFLVKLTPKMQKFSLRSV